MQRRQWGGGIGLGLGTTAEPLQRHGRVARGWGPGRAIAREWRRPGLSSSRKRTLERNQTREDTKRRCRTRGGRGGCTGNGEKEEHDATTPDRQGTGPRSRPAGGKSGRADYGGRQEEEGDLGRENPKGRQGPGRRSRTAKGGKPDEGRQSQAHERNSVGRPAWEESADERWRPAGGGAVQVDGRSAPGRDGGGRSGCKEREKRRRRVKDGGMIGDRSRGREKRSERSRNR